MWRVVTQTGTHLTQHTEISAQEIQGTVKGGSVVSVTYDEEDNAEIIYEVKAKGLKKKVSAAEWQ